VLVAGRRREALTLIRGVSPNRCSCLDIFLPDMLGWTVFNHMKLDAATRHIPVQILTLDETASTASRVAHGFSTKPISPESRQASFTKMKQYALPRRKTVAGRGRRTG